MKQTVSDIDHINFLENRKIPTRFYDIQNQKMREGLKQHIEWIEKSYKIGIEKVEMLMNMLNLPKENLQMIMENLKDKKILKLQKWLYKECNSKFFLTNIFDGNKIAFYTRDLNVGTVIQYTRPHETVATILGDSESTILQIESLHSAKKGEGYKVMKNILSFAERHKITVTLWTETDENVKYFERYGFKSHGRLGAEQEYLMIIQNGGT